MVGSQVLDQLLSRSDVEEVISIGRRKSGRSDPRLKEIVHDNFLDFSGMKSELQGIDVCIYCLAVYQGQVSKQQYEVITCDYQQALTDVLQETSPNLAFVLFGASGADPSEKSKMLFAKVKGRAEKLLMEAPFPHKYIVRPAFIYPTGEKQPPGFMYRILNPIVYQIARLIPSIMITDAELASAMVTLSLNPTRASGALENVEIKAVAAQGSLE